jgi:secondary thiamine-phosphate synthase enzyme
MHTRITLASSRREELIDITARVRAAVDASGVRQGLVALFAQGSTCALMIQENWDASVPADVVSLLRQLVPRGGWLHDRVDGNADAHLKAGLVGASQSIPLIDGRMALGQWQNIFFCEFDGPRPGRTVICTVLPDRPALGD